MNKDDAIRLQHMLEAAQAALEFARDETRSSLNTDRKLAFAIIRAIEIVGEAASRVSRDFQAAHSEILWPDIIGMRNKIVHAYFDINLEAVWRTVTEDLPPLIAQVEQILAQDEDADT